MIRRIVLCAVLFAWLAALAAVRPGFAAPVLAQSTDDAGQPAAGDSLDDELLRDLEEGDPEGVSSDEPPAPAEPSGESAASEQDAADRGRARDKSSPQPAAGDSLDEELLEGLGGLDDLPGESGDPAAPGDSAQSNDADPLSQLSRRMREVESLIAQAQSDASIQEKQRTIVADLAKLIEEMRKRQQQQSSSSGKSQQTASRNQPQPGRPAGSKPGQKPARDSSERLRNDKARKPDPAEMKALLKDVWGHLPARERQQMDQYMVEEFLPKYELEIEQYFKALAGQLGQPNN
ncbi:MAG: hypothetical protein WD847_21385 [Pirellulales bacterium]